MKILLVDDDKNILHFLKSSLKMENFIVDTAEDGEKAAYLGCVNDYDLIILDYSLPKKDGSIVCREIRKSGKKSPILMLSVRSEIEDKVNLLDLGADDYLTKPFSLEELLARTRALLRRPEFLQEDILAADNLILDKKKFLVKRGEKEIRLTSKEFSLLQYLLENKNRVMSKNMILEHIWDSNADSFSNTIETHISNLRKKIDFKGEKKLIKTITARGYKVTE